MQAARRHVTGFEGHALSLIPFPVVEFHVQPDPYRNYGCSAGEAG